MAIKNVNNNCRKGPAAMRSNPSPSRKLAASVASLSSSLWLHAFVCLALVAGDLSAQVITRAPYLQIGTPSTMTVRWRTDAASTGRVRYGTDATNLSSVADMAGSSTEHTVTLTGL